MSMNDEIGLTEAKAIETVLAADGNDTLAADAGARVVPAPVSVNAINPGPAGQASSGEKLFAKGEMMVTGPVAAPAVPAKPRAPMARVLDSTAIEGVRIHDMPINGVIRKFTFEPGKGLEMPQEIAAKFLRHDAFKLVDEHGEIQPYARPPKQPEELQAGETLTLADHETVARFDELSGKALLQRCAERPGGEKFAERPDRAAMVAFLISEANSKRIKTMPPKPSDEEFTPAPADGDEAAMFDRGQAA